MNDLDQAAIELARHGEAVVNRVFEIAECARKLLERGELPPSAVPQPAPFPWETPEPFVPGARRQVYLGSVDDAATGEGLTISFFAGVAVSENSFRQAMAREVGVNLANSAVINHGSGSTVPFGALFISPALAAKLRHIELGEDRPGAFSYFARLHANYS